MTRSESVTSAAPPRLRSLVDDPLTVSRPQLVCALTRPWVMVVVFGVFAALGWWVPAALTVVLIFGSDVVVVHDLFHRNLGLSPRVNELLVGVYGSLLLNSGHALAVTHRRHHRVYPAAGDPEAYVDGWPLWRVVLEGPVYRFRVWRWALANAGRYRWMMRAEMSVYGAAWVVAIVWGGRLPAVRCYVVAAELGSWLFPLISVTGVHDRNANGHLRQTRTLRHPVARVGMLGMQYHLEHHLYPRVPACRLDELADALEPWLRDNGAAVWGRSELPLLSSDGPSDLEGNTGERNGDRWSGLGRPHRPEALGPCGPALR